MGSTSLFAGLKDVRREFYRYPVPVEAILSRSFPDPGGADAFRQAVAEDVGIDRIGIAATRDDDGQLGFSFPVVIVSGVKWPFQPA